MGLKSIKIQFNFNHFVYPCRGNSEPTSDGVAGISGAEQDTEP